MRKFYLFSFALFVSALCAAQGYNISLKSNYKTGIAYLTYYRGPNSMIQDSAAVANMGTVIFKGPQKLPGGIYSIYLPGKRQSVDFVIDKDQTFHISIDTADLRNPIIKGSAENDVYLSYSAFMNDRGPKMQRSRNALTAAKTKADSLTFETELKTFAADIAEYRQHLIGDTSSGIMGVLLNAMRDPAAPPKIARTLADSIENYNYFRDHYWDGTDFMDDRVLRTPFFLPKLERYYREVMPQAADSLIPDISYKLLLARNSPEMFRFLINWFTDEYINPKYMGQDAVYVYLFEQYHSKGLTPWLNEKQQKTISDRAYMVMANLVGRPAAPLDFLGLDNKPSPLYDVKADYTVVAFWDPACGHCKEEIPKLDSLYRAVWEKQNIKIYAVLTEQNEQAWRDYITEHKISDWIHVYQSKAMADSVKNSQSAGYKQLYDITQTPTLYLLDKDKRIVGKKLTRYQMNSLIDAGRSSKK